MNECCRKYSIWRSSFASQLSCFCSSCIQCNSLHYSYYLTWFTHAFVSISRLPWRHDVTSVLSLQVFEWSLVGSKVQLADAQFSLCSKLHVPPCNIWIQMRATLVLYRNPDLGKGCLFINFTTRELAKHYLIRQVYLKRLSVSLIAWLRNQPSVSKTTEQEAILLFFWTQFIFYKRNIKLILRLHLCIQLFYLLLFDYSITFVVIQLTQLLLLLGMTFY